MVKRKARGCIFAKAHSNHEDPASDHTSHHAPVRYKLHGEKIYRAPYAPVDRFDTLTHNILLLVRLFFAFLFSLFDVGSLDGSSNESGFRASVLREKKIDKRTSALSPKTIHMTNVLFVTVYRRNRNFVRNQTRFMNVRDEGDRADRSVVCVGS